MGKSVNFNCCFGSFDTVSFYSGANKQDEALECYGRAANLFKMAKKWSQAGQTFVTVATHHAKLGNKHDSATNYVDAANCYKKSDPKGKLVFPPFKLHLIDLLRF